jgi:N-carbamoyl-L-amino-acid hydrolase
MTVLPRPGLQHLLRTDHARLLRTVDELAEIGGLPGGGVTRLGFTAEEDQARRYLQDRARGAGLVARVDEAGNVVMRRRCPTPGAPALLMGSHMDSVANGGRLDGAYGVVAALEVLTTLVENDIDLALEPVAVAFTNEEAGLFPYPFFGSRGLAGTLDPDAAYVNRYGADLAPALARAGGDLRRVRNAAWAPGSIGAYLELHIEQGPYLEAQDIPLAVVGTITGRITFDIHIRGRSGHAGATPMDCRADALVAASHAVLVVEGLSRQGMCVVSTVGRVEAWPDQVNVIPGEAWLAGELRDLSIERMDAAESALRMSLADLERRHQVQIEVKRTDLIEPVATDQVVRDAIGRAATMLNVPNTRLHSAAGHDAQIIGAVAPIGMIFIPSRGGLSHVPDEHSSPEHLAAGADVLLHTALDLGSDDLTIAEIHHRN